MDELATFGRGAEPAPATTVMRHMVYGSGLTHALDYVVLLHLLFMLEEDRPVTVKDLWEGLQAEGIRSAKNAKELVGRDAVYDAVKRLIAARFVHRVEEGGTPGRFGQVRYLVYRQPAYHPQFIQQSEPWEPQDHPDFPHSKPQVVPLPGTPEAAALQASSDGKIAGRTASRNAGYGVPGSGVPGHGNPRIPAGRTASGVPGSGLAFPPTPPPGGGGTSSPYPLNAGAVDGGHGKEEGEGAAHQHANRARLEEMADFLADLPAPWRAGRRTARELAPLLLEAVTDQGWELGPELVRLLTQNPGGVRSFPATLKSRIDDLPRARRKPQPGAVLPEGSDRCPRHPVRELATCPCQLPEDRSQPRPAADVQEEDPEAVRAAAEQALAKLRSRVTDSSQASQRRPRSRTAREAVTRQEAESHRRAADMLLAGNADGVSVAVEETR